MRLLRRSAPAAVLFLLASCAGLRPVPLERAPGQWLGRLPPESTFYLSVRASNCRELLSRAVSASPLRDPEVQQLLARTQQVYGGFLLAPGLPPSYSLILLGDYNASRLRCSLSWSREWHRQRGAQPFWEKAGKPLQLAAPWDGLLLISDRGMAPVLARLEVPGSFSMPQEAYREMEQADLFAYFPTLPGLETQGSTRLPLRSLWVSAGRSGDRYALRGVFLLTEVREPRLLQALFKLLLASWLRRGELGAVADRLRALEIAVDERFVVIQGLELSTREMASILGPLLGLGEGGA